MRLRNAVQKSAEIPEHTATRRSSHTVALSCAFYPLMWGESFGPVFPEFRSKLQRLAAFPEFGLYLCGFVSPSDRHIVRGETQGKVVRLMTFESFMELHAVDFERKQSDSVGLAVESIVHHL